MEAAQIIRPELLPSAFGAFYRQVRESSRRLCETLSDADATVQSMPDASPAKWHLAHTTWFFETMILVPHLAGYRVFDERYNFLFNSYYETIGARQPRARGALIGCRRDRAVDARCQPGEMASGAHHVVFRGNGIGAAGRELPMLRRALQFSFQFLL